MLASLPIQRAMLGFFLVSVCMFTVIGCALFDVQEEKSAPELAADGMDAYESGDYRGAIDNFEKLKDWYPFSKYAILAELKIADAHYMRQEYEEAIFAYEEFENLHPRNEAIPYVVYQIGLCYFERIDTVDRDQSTAAKALETFRRLRKQFPKDEFSRKAREKVTRCLQSMAGHDLYVGRFYYKSKHYKSALYRFQTVIKDYPDVGIHHEALHYIALCQDRLRNEADSK